MKTAQKQLFPLLLIFILVDLVVVAMPTIFDKWGLDKWILLVANLIYLLVSLAVFQLQKKAHANENPNVFVRSVMTGMLIKMGVVLVSLFAYWALSGDHFSKPTIIAAVILYLIYFITGVYCTMQMNKPKNA
ncbi:MAG: hypothetical protein WCJ85_01095 [Chitinophagaceae bacterium]